MSQDKLPGSQKAPTLVMTMEAAKRYELRSFWVRRRRAGKQEAYSGRCVVWPTITRDPLPWGAACRSPVGYELSLRPHRAL